MIFLLLLIFLLHSYTTIYQWSFDGLHGISTYVSIDMDIFTWISVSLLCSNKQTETDDTLSEASGATGKLIWSMMVGVVGSTIGTLDVWRSVQLNVRVKHSFSSDIDTILALRSSVYYRNAKRLCRAEMGVPVAFWYDGYERVGRGEGDRLRDWTK